MKDFEVVPIGTMNQIKRAEEMVQAIDIILSKDGVVPVQILNAYKSLKEELTKHDDR